MDLVYELWLHDICNFDAKKVDKCLYIFENAYNAFHSKPYSPERIKGFGLSAFLSKSRELDFAYRIIEECRQMDIRIITIDDKEYPEILKQIYLPPRILFVKGSFTDFNNYFGVTIVGTRKSTAQGKLFTKKLAKSLVKNNKIMIVSGMAEGIDRHAHLGALEAGGKTVAILAGGVDIIYPKSNRDIYNKILKSGAIISDKPPGTIGKDYFYKLKNRIVAGMSRCSVIVEGDYNSGSRHTANHALDNNRDVFAVPSSPLSRQSRLPSKLIKDGASIIVDESDIINQYCEIYPEYFNTNSNNNKKENKSSLYNNLNNEERQIVDYIIKCGGTASAEDMAAKLSISVGKLNGTLTLLCLKDVLCQHSQSQYILKEA